MRSIGRFARLTLVMCFVGSDGLTGQVGQLPIVDWETTGSPVLGEWGGLEGALRVPDGSIWVSDAMLGRVVRIDAAGQYQLIAQKGDGPGELLAPTRLAALPDGGVAVLDGGRGSIDRFGLDGVFVDRLRLPGPVMSPKGFLATSDGDFLVSGYLNESTHAIHRLDGQSGRVLWSAVPPPATVHELRALRHIVGGAIVWADKTSVLLALASPIRVYRVNVESGTAEMVLSDSDALEFIGDDFIEPGRTPYERLRYRWSYPRVTGLAYSGRGEILLVVTNREDGRSQWRYYDHASGTLHRSLSLDRPLEILDLNAEYHFLALDWPFETQENILVVGRVPR